MSIIETFQVGTKDQKHIYTQIYLCLGLHAQKIGVGR